MYAATPYPARHILAALHGFADRGRRAVEKRRILQHDEALGIPGSLRPLARVYIYDIAADDSVVFEPAAQRGGRIGPHQQREAHVGTVVLLQILQRADRVRRPVEQKLHGRGLDPVGIARRGAGRLGHFEAAQLGCESGGLLQRVLRRDDQHDLVAQPALHGVFGQRDVAPVHGVERAEV